MGRFGMMNFGSGWFWNLVGLLFVIWIISWIFMPWRRRHGRWHEEPEEILRRRYAKGEITQAQFKKMMNDLARESRRQ
jgi:uncharacterized membrane protein